MPKDLDGKVALITGSTQGLGAAIARRFVAEGGQVVISGRTREHGEAIAAELGAAAIYHRTDLAKVDDCRAVVQAALRAFGGIDVVVNSAATTARSTLENFTPELFDRQFAINVRGPLLVIQSALASLRERGGTVINIGSVNAYLGGSNLLVYSATKGALMTASRNMANALLSPRVRVFCLNVGWMDSDGERAVLAEEGLPPDFIEREGKKMPIGRLLAPAEVAEVCFFLASPRSQAFSGAVIDLEQFPLGALSYPTTPQV